MVLNYDRPLARENLNHVFDGGTGAPLLVDFRSALDQHANFRFIPVVIDRDRQPRRKPAQELSGHTARIRIEIPRDVIHSRFDSREESLEEREEPLQKIPAPLVFLINRRQITKIGKSGIINP